ncbi:copper resistance CopC/CopD family protein [Streptomyces sp. NBC_00154]|uniref:copper resistance CopC/CopD family protein n=1 Tax=Streptomyces sp. NBC_00154 TaxID=2975670 RepID=UPI00224ECAC5|nr:copper resistance protein CopC [Streptomyces sp. NBC_00154]MCX5316143.1 copper resistance protein CopC [Streptomyces sp. NBC_00154]
MTVTAPRLRSWAFVVLAVVGLLLGSTAPADAHAALTNSTPEQGAVTTQAPARVVLVFSEKVALSSSAVRVLDPAGRRVDDAKPRAQHGTTYAVGLRGKLDRGTYTVVYHVVSADSHPVAGAFTFSVGAPSKTSVSASSAVASADSTPVGRAYTAGRFGAYAGLLLLVGGVSFLLACWPQGQRQRLLRRAVVAGWGVVSGCSAALLLMRGAYTGSGRFGEIADWSRLVQAAQTKAGVMLGVRLILLAACALVWFLWLSPRQRRTRPVALMAGRKDALLKTGAAVVAVALAATWAGAEHASTGLQSTVAVPVDVLHLLAAAVWLGGLCVLTLALWRTPKLPVSAVTRFSRLAFTSVVVLAGTGLYQSWRQVGSFSALTGTRYGQLLTAKVAAVGLLLCLAYFSRRFTSRLAVSEAVPDTVAAPPRVAQAVPARHGPPTRAAETAGREKPPAPSRQEGGGRPVLRRWVAAEALVGVCVLAITTALTSTEPARTQESLASSRSGAATAPAVQMEFDTHGARGRGTATVVVDPGRSGTNAVHVSITEPGGAMLDVPEVQVSLTSKAQGIGPLRVPVRRASAGHWTMSGFQVPVAGVWELAVTVRTSEVDQVTVRRQVSIG